MKNVESCGIGKNRKKVPSVGSSCVLRSSVRVLTTKSDGSWKVPDDPLADLFFNFYIFESN